jgi:membrane protein DedA with SNARE-associated domain
LPIPEESLMVLSGILMSQGHLYITPTIMAALAGRIVGITVSYFLGITAGHYLLLKYGGWVGLREHHLERAHQWVARFGKWALFIGYFIPGLRHLTGFSAGTTNIDYPQFALFAYSGAILWVSTFLSIGYFFGEKWLSTFENIEVGGIDDLIIMLIILVTCVSAYLLSKRVKKI